MTTKRVLTLFSSPVCSLCVPVKEVLADAVAASGGRLELRVVDISRKENREAFLRYRDDIPVVLLEGVEVARHRLSREQLEAGLQSREAAEKH